MAHNITERDGIFTVREPAWHGLGAVLPEYPTRAQAQELAHPWEPTTEPLYVHRPQITAEGVTDSYEQVTDQVAVRRSDNDELLGTVSNTYGLVTNSEMYDIAEAIEGQAAGSVRYETGGSLKGGRKVWLLIRLNEPISMPGDPHGETIPYYALQNAHDGSGSFRGQATLTRIVCDNTSHMADLDAKARGTEFTFRHTSNIGERIEEAKAALAGWRESVQEYRLMGEHLAGERINAAQVQDFIDQFIPAPPPHAASDRVMENVRDARFTLGQCLASPTCEGIRDTRWGLVQAAVEYNQHVRAARSAESRFKRAYLDRSAITADALALAQRV